MYGAIDIGYGWTKVCGETRPEVSFPSVVGSVDVSRFGLGRGEPIILSNGMGRIMVGDEVIEQSRFTHREEGRAWIRSTQYMGLFLAGLTELSRAASVDISLVTGLPLAYYDDRPDLTGLLSGSHRVTREYPERVMTHTYNVTAHVIPQPFGTLFSLAFSSEGKVLDREILEGTVGIIDIGSHTTNILTVSQAREITRGTTSIPTGCWDIIRGVARQLEGLFPSLERRDHELVQDIIRGEVPYYGKRQSIRQVVEEVSLPMAEEIIGAATQHWNSGAALDRILITGGGTFLVGPRIMAHFSRHGRVESPADPIFANVHGYLRYAKYLKL